MMDPICLIENKNAQFSVNQKALQILENISQPVVVVAIVGLCRTGKSYLMNRLAGQNHDECYTTSRASYLNPSTYQLLNFLTWSRAGRTKFLSVNQISSYNSHH